MMYSTTTFNDPMTGYCYGNSLDYQSNLINGVNTNIYSNANSVIKYVVHFFASNSIINNLSYNYIGFLKLTNKQKN